MDMGTVDAISGFLVDLVQLRNLLLRISSGDHKWSCPRDIPPDETSISIRYTNPLYGPNLPNEIVFRFPVVLAPTLFYEARETTYACLSPFVAHAVQAGLYFQDDELRGDVFEDWDVFWLPIHAELELISARFGADPL